jgi:hypothetical protein
MANDYSDRQRRHATKIATERALMDTFGISRSQARKLNEGLDELHKQADQRAVPQPEVLGPPVPPDFKYNEVKTEKTQGGALGRQGPAAGPQNAPGGGVVRVQAIVISGSSMTAVTLDVRGQIV